MRAADGASSGRDPRTVVAPERTPELADAVTRAGAQLVDDPGQATVLVWTGFDPAGVAAYLRDGIEFVQLAQSGVDRWIDAGVIDERRVWASSAGAFGDVVAERALALLLAGIHRLHEHARVEQWSRLFGGRLRGSRVLIAGTGAIGRELATAIRALGADAVGMNRSGAPVAEFDEVCGGDEWPDVCEGADHLVLALPLTGQTRAMVNATSLGELGPHSVVVNVGRGASVDTDALLDALDAGRLGAACLDVTWPDPLPAGHGLWRQPRALVTSHTSNPRHDRAALLAAHVEGNVRRWLAGEQPHSVIDLVRGY